MYFRCLGKIVFVVFITHEQCEKILNVLFSFIQMTKKQHRNQQEKPKDTEKKQKQPQHQ